MENILSDLTGKTYLVTGASSGIGAATALALGRVGANVVLAARQETACRELAEQIVASGGQALVVRTDIGVEQQVREAVSATVQHFGRLDGAFNNAGTLGVAAPLHEIGSDDFMQVMRINVLGVFWSMKYQIEAMLQSGGGAIVNNASITSQLGFPSLSPYNASKHAVVGLTRTAGLEYFQRGIRINAVSPGPVATPMAVQGFGGPDRLQAAMIDSPAGRAGSPDEIAKPVLFLLSEAASYFSGQSITIDGGFTVQ
ncbi:SDR family NAD(P)-dependent oxidoreductase [Chitinimonas lacunae]|uniref:SDR family NAD(P)-dependent oxidoreductase n=1 Tax=Chitinimonas lacunae TaxID=1963018 RepID=A0ABV8MKC1_9NEIS